MKIIIISFWVFLGAVTVWFNPVVSQIKTDTTFQGNKVIVKNKQNVTIEIYQQKNGKKQGGRRTYNYQGVLVLEEHYKNDFLHGKRIEFDNAGNLKVIEKYKFLQKENKSVLNGVQNKYNNNILVSSINFKEGKKNGHYKLYYNDGSLKEKGKYQDNLKVGKNIVFDSNKNKLKKEHYIIIASPHKKPVSDNPKSIEDIKKPVYVDDYVKKSVLNGRSKYYRNGQITHNISYKKGQKNGLSLEYYTNPKHQLKSKEIYKDGLRHGPFIFFTNSGEIERKGIYFQEIKVGDTVFKNVYDGEISYYRKNGLVEKVENWSNYRKNGVQKKYNVTGTLTYLVEYKDDLKVGEETYWDQDGNKSREEFYKIITENGVKKSVKHGMRRYWKNGILTSETPFENGLVNGLHKEYYSNGNLKEEKNFVNDSLLGVYNNYFENGKIEREYHYKSTKRGNNLIDWNKVYDTEGNIITAFYTDGLGNNLVSKRYENNHFKEFSVKDVLRIAYNPTGQLLSFHIPNSNQNGFDFYSNQKIRRVHFFYSDSYPKTASFTQDGDLIQVVNNNGYIKEEDSVNKFAEQIALQANPKWNVSKLVTEDVKNGKYQLAYSNGKPFLEIEFIDDLPQGEWLIFDAISNDTIFYAEFEKGKRVGKWIRKRTGGIPFERKTYDKDHQLISNFTYFKDGNIREENRYKDKERIFIREYYENAQLKSESDNLKKSYFRYKENGMPLYSSEFIIGEDSLKVIQNYYATNVNMKDKKIFDLRANSGVVETFYENGKTKFKYETDLKEKLEGEFRQYGENGKLEFLGYYKNGRKTGTWKTYNEQGNIVKTEEYKNGELIIAPEDERECACYDKSLESSKIGFAQSASFFADYKAIRLSLPKYIVPIDSFNYKSIFFVNFQGYTDGFCQMKLLPAREVAFYTSTDQYLKINLTPCATSGYLSNFHSSFNVSRGNLEYAQIDLKRIAISLERNPLTTKDGKPFTGYFDAKSLYLAQNKINISLSKSQNECFTSGMINSFMKVDVLGGGTVLSQFSNEKNTSSIQGVPLKRNEIENFNGFVIDTAKIRFVLVEKMSEKIGRGSYIPIAHQVFGTANKIIVGANWLAGEIEIEGNLADEDAFFVKDDASPISLKYLEEFLTEKKFYRISTEYVKERKVLKIQFFTEK